MSANLPTCPLLLVTHIAASIAARITTTFKKAAGVGKAEDKSRKA